ncbi:DNA-directed RNA polymerases I, II, and III subunit RPABC1 [Cucumispora dikerogammari]|nr:DNA-directed RNA polymerases I, II, and III subunit RPABC1 [Cucumispora dikerogammari]
MSEFSIVLHNLHEMLNDRKILVQLESLSTSTTVINNKLLLMFIQDKLSLKMLKEISETNAANGIQHIILIVDEKPSPSILKYIQELRHVGLMVSNQIDKKNTELFIEYFTKDELMYNPTHHIYVPQHTLLSDEEKLEILKKYKCSEFELPKILETDRICRYFGGRKGQVFKINRKTKEGNQDFYRLVV